MGLASAQTSCATTARPRIPSVGHDSRGEAERWRGGEAQRLRAGDSAEVESGEVERLGSGGEVETPSF